MFNGGLPTLVLGLPMAAVLAPLQMGFVLFLVGSACALVAVYALSALVLALQLKR